MPIFLNRMTSQPGDSQQIGALIHASRMMDSDLDLTSNARAASASAVMPQHLHQYNNDWRVSVSAYYGYPPPPPLPSLMLRGQGPMLNYTNDTASAMHLGDMIPFQNSNFTQDMSFVSTSPPMQAIEPHRLSISSTQFYQPNIMKHAHATSLFTESDSSFLDPVHNFIRCKCIELFVVTQADMMDPGRGARSSKLGQVGLRCFYCKDAPRQELAKQAVLFPSKRETIFESVRNFQRAHLNACTYIPEQVKAEYKNLIEHDGSRKKPVKYVKAYYAEAASELGLVDTPNGLIFGAPPNRTGIPSERLGALIRAVESPATRSSFWKTYSSGKDEDIQMKKFEHVASYYTREIIINARREPSPLVYPQDFPTISDIDFLLFHQVSPCRPPAARLEHRGLNAAQFNSLSGLCCKHCACANARDISHKGVYFPTSLAALSDSSFSQTLLNHIMRRPNVHQEIKNTFDELK